MKDEREHGVSWSHRGRYQLASRLLCSMPQRQGHNNAHYCQYNYILVKLWPALQIALERDLGQILYQN